MTNETDNPTAGYIMSSKPPKPANNWDKIRQLAVGEHIDLEQSAAGSNSIATGCSILGKRLGRSFGRKVLSEAWPYQTVRVKRFE